MPERRGSRFVVEALFLAGLAVALALAQLEPLEIVGAMALGWLVIAAIEWTAWRGEPHYGSGLPPRYYLPRVDLPPPQPLEQVVQGYPDSARDDAPTWIASASLRAAVLGEWPLSGPPPPEDEEPVFVPPAEATDPWTAIALPPTPDDRQIRPTPSVEPVLRRSPRSGGPTSWYTVDPFGDPMPRRRPRRENDSNARWIRVPTWPRPAGLPSSLPKGG
jgi:hypothetical protein